MITHDLQALLEDLLCTNISHLTSSILTLNFAQAKQATRRCGAVSNDALYEESALPLKCVFRRKKALKQISNAFHSSAVSNDALYEEVLVLVTYLLICFTWARAQKKESSIASSFQLVLISLFEQRDIYKYKESIIIKSTLANRII